MLLLASCRAPLPSYPTRPVEESLRVLASRASQLQTFSGAGSLTVRDPDRGSVTLEAAIVARRPDQVRVRAWKLGRSVADITLDGDRVEGETDPRVDRDTLVEGVRALRTVLLWVDGAFYERAARDAGTDGATIRARGTVAGVPGPVLAGIERRTLTLRSLEIEGNDAGGSGAGSFTLDRYREVEGMVWPMRISASSHDRQAVFRLDWVELNTPIARGALPERADPDRDGGGGP